MPEDEKQYPEEVSDLEENESQYSLPPDFKYTPIEIPHRVDIFVLILAWVIIGILGYVLFK